MPININCDKINNKCNKQRNNFSFIKSVDNDKPNDDPPSWYSFSNNKDYAYDLTSFICEDTTPSAKEIDWENGSTLIPSCTIFSKWNKRDLGSTFEKFDPDAKPGKPSNAKASFEDGKLSINWKKSKSDLWHYNIYKVKEGEEISYLNLL